MDGVVDNLFSGRISSSVSGGQGQGGDVNIAAGNLEVLNGSRIDSETNGTGNAGNIFLDIRENTLVGGVNPIDGSSSEISSSVFFSDAGIGGKIKIRSASVVVSDNAKISAATFGAYREGDAGSIEIFSDNTYLYNGTLSTSSGTSYGNAGNITVMSERLQSLDGTISASSDVTENGQIQIFANIVILEGDSDIQSFSNSGSVEGNGSVSVSANALIALDDSDIISVVSDGRGGNLLIENVYSENLTPFTLVNDISNIDNNAQVDFVSTGSISASFADVPLKNTLNELSYSFIDTEVLIGHICILSNKSGVGSFTATGRDRLPQAPTETTSTAYPTGTVQSISIPPETVSITEPQAIYQLADGRLLMSRDCQQ